MSVDANGVREASSFAFSYALLPRGQLATVINAPLQDRACSSLPVSTHSALIPAIRFLPFLFLVLASVSAQTGVRKLLEQGMLQAVAGLAPVPAKDKVDVLDATATLLAKNFTFRPDGTASSYYTESGRRPVEWKNFVVRHITLQAVTEAHWQGYRPAAGDDAGEVNERLSFCQNAPTEATSTQPGTTHWGVGQDNIEG